MVKNCKLCGEQFLGKRSDAVYCSPNCGNKYRNRNHYKKHPELYRQRREHNNHDFAKKSLATLKYKAKKINVPFDIGVEDIITPEFCPVLGLKLKRCTGTGSWGNCSPSVDRIIPELGYVKGNVRVISARANLLKSNATVEELELVLKDLKKLRENP